MTQYPRPETRPSVKLIGADGNAFAIIGKCKEAAKRAGWATEQWEVVRSEMTAGDYDHLLATAMEYFEIE